MTKIWYTKAQADTLLGGKAANVHTHTAAQVTDLDAAIGAKAEVATLNNAFGSTGGAPIKPWQPPALIGPELAIVGNLYNDGNFGSLVTNTVALSLTGSSQSKFTRFIIHTPDDYYFRLAFDFAVTTIPGEAFDITVSWRNTGDGAIGNTQTITATNTRNPKSGRAVFDFERPLAGLPGAGVEVRISYLNNVTTATTATVSNVSLSARAGRARTPQWSGQGFSYDQEFLRYHWDVNERRWYLSAESFGNLAGNYSYNGIRCFSDTFPWSSQLIIPDGAFAEPGGGNGGGYIGATATALKGTATMTSMRVGNNDQIFVAQPLAGGAFEYRGNVHGGETLNGSVVAKVHNDDAWVDVTAQLDKEGAFPARRFQWTWPTKITCTGDAAAFVNVTHLFTAFPDGVTRCDRTNTFTRATTVGTVFEWLASYDPNAPRLGRMGRGNDVTDSIDIFTHAAIPAAPTVTPSTTGGTLAAGTYSYRVTARTPLGETLAGPAATGTTTGTTGSTTVSWTAVTSATGYGVYGRVAGAEYLLATVGPVTSWVDTGATGGSAQKPKEDTARTVAGPAIVMPVLDDRATWACWFDPISGWAHGNIYDRESTLARTGYGITGSRAALVSLGGIVKNYNTLLYNAATVTIPSGTVWTATHWSMIWRPENPARFHHEIAVRAASLSALKAIYPST